MRDRVERQRDSSEAGVLERSALEKMRVKCIVVSAIFIFINDHMYMFFFNVQNSLLMHLNPIKRFLLLAYAHIVNVTLTFARQRQKHRNYFNTPVPCTDH